MQLYRIENIDRKKLKDHLEKKNAGFTKSCKCVDSAARTTLCEDGEVISHIITYASLVSGFNLHFIVLIHTFI